MNLIHEANVAVADLQRALKFRRKKTMKAGLRRLDGNSLIAFSIKGLVNEAHASLAYLSENLKSIGDDLSDLKGAPADLG